MDNNFSKILETFKRLDEAANPAQQAAIAIAMKKAHKKPKTESEYDERDMDEPWAHAQVTQADIARSKQVNKPAGKYSPEVYDRMAKDPEYARHIRDMQKQHHGMAEGMTKEAMWKDAERMTRDQFCEKWGDEHAEFWDAIMGEMDEGSMADAEHHPDGPHFGGYWKGTDPNPPKPGQGVGGMEESGVEANYVQGAGVDDSQSPIHTRRLSVDEEWDAFMNEIAGANNPAQGTSSTGTNSIDAAKTAKEISNAQQSLNKFKAAGTNLPVSVGQAAKSAVATASNPTAATTGQGLDSNAKKTTMGLGQQIEKLLATGNQGQVQQVANAIKQSNMGQK